MITPAESLARCERELHPAKLYTVAQIARIVGIDAANVARAIDKGVLAVREDHRPRSAYGHQVIRFAQWRLAQVKRGTGVLAVSRSMNAKLGGAAVTLVARQSCPTTCPFQSEGCYAEHDNNRVIWDRLTNGAPDKSPLELARAEADAIDRLPGDLRLHVAGDSTTDAGTRLIAAACESYIYRGWTGDPGLGLHARLAHGSS